MQIHAERRGSRLIVGLEGKEEGRGGGEIAVGKEREESFFAVSCFFFFTLNFPPPEGLVEFLSFSWRTTAKKEGGGE